MDYCQRLVSDYLRADRALFLNEQCMIQLEECHNPDKTRHWLCDVVAADFKAKKIWLCEVTYDRSLTGLTKRLREWLEQWDSVCAARSGWCSQRPSDLSFKISVPQEFWGKCLAWKRN
jgi:hypothetical protein